MMFELHKHYRMRTGEIFQVVKIDHIYPTYPVITLRSVETLACTGRGPSGREFDYEGAPESDHDFLDKVEVETITTLCPYCQNNVECLWVKNGGCITLPDTVLVGDLLFHGPCWDSQIEEHPPEISCP